MLTILGNSNKLISQKICTNAHFKNIFVKISEVSSAVHASFWSFQQILVLFEYHSSIFFSLVSYSRLLLLLRATNDDDISLGSANEEVAYRLG